MAALTPPQSPKKSNLKSPKNKPHEKPSQVVAGMKVTPERVVTIQQDPMECIYEGSQGSQETEGEPMTLHFSSGTAVSATSSTAVDASGSSMLSSSKSGQNTPRQAKRQSNKSEKGKRSRELVHMFLDGEVGAVQKATRSTWSSSRRTVFGEIDNWSPLRIRVYDAVMTKSFENCIMLSIVCSFMTMIYEADEDARCYPKYKNDTASCPTSVNNIAWLRASNIGFLTLYALEAAAFMYVQRLRYFRQRTKLLDFFVVVASLVAECTTVFGKLGWLRILRVHHLFRHPGLKHMREMFFLARGFTGAARAIAFGGLLLGCMLVCFAVPVVHHIHPTNVEIEYEKCERCPRGYASVAASTLTLYQQTVLGDEWGIMSIPNMERSWKAAIALPVIQLTIGVGVLSLILAVIVDCGVEARTLTKKEELQEKAMLQRTRKLQMLEMFEAIDVQNAGFLTFEQVSTSIDNSFVVWMKDVGLVQGDLADIFDYIDDRSVGKVSYIELVNVLDALTQMPANVVATLARAKVVVLDRKVTDINDELKELNCKLDILVARQSSLGFEVALGNAAVQESWQETNRMDRDLRDNCLNAAGIGPSPRIW